MMACHLLAHRAALANLIEDTPKNRSTLRSVSEEKAILR